jgi:hypothetical protein
VYSTVNFNVYFGSVLLWQPERLCINRSFDVSFRNYSLCFVPAISVVKLCFSKCFSLVCCSHFDYFEML